MARLMHYRGERGELEILPEGTVEREAAEKGERIYQLADLPELLGELRGSGIPRAEMVARGSGYQPSARTCLLNVEEVHAVPEFEQTSLFTGAPLAVEELIKQQHVRGPQGLTAFVDPEWEDDEESALFLEALLGIAEVGAMLIASALEIGPSGE